MVQRLKKSGSLIAISVLAVAISGCGIDFDPLRGLSRSRLRKHPPVACPKIAVVCDAGQEVADVDGDGCALECRAISQDGGAACTKIAVHCEDHQVLADLDGDGCPQECLNVDEEDAGSACIEIAVECPEGEVPTDVDGDGCALECASALDGGHCGNGGGETDAGTPTDPDDDAGTPTEPPTDPDEDGGVACPDIYPVCADDEEVADVDGDGCALECQPIAIDAGIACPAVWVECSDHSTPIDANGDGCALECPKP